MKMRSLIITVIIVFSFTWAHAAPPVEGEGYDTTTNETTSPDNSVVWGDNLEEISEEEELTAFKNAIILAGVDKEIKSGDFSIFAPINEVFEEMDPDILAKLEAVENRRYLVRLIRMHIAPGTHYMIKSNEKTTRMKTLSKQDVIIAKKYGRSFYINNKKIVSKDMHADGILYKLDGLVTDVEQWEFKEPGAKQPKNQVRILPTKN